LQQWDLSWFHIPDNLGNIQELFVQLGAAEMHSFWRDVLVPLAVPLHSMALPARLNLWRFFASMPKAPQLSLPTLQCLEHPRQHQLRSLVPWQRIDHHQLNDILRELRIGDNPAWIHLWLESVYLKRVKPTVKMIDLWKNKVQLLMRTDPEQLQMRLNKRTSLHAQLRLLNKWVVRENRGYFDASQAPLPTLTLNWNGSLAQFQETAHWRWRLTFFAHALNCDTPILEALWVGNRIEWPARLDLGTVNLPNLFSNHPFKPFSCSDYGGQRTSAPYYNWPPRKAASILGEEWSSIGSDEDYQV
jgi:hypothetical protein